MPALPEAFLARPVAHRALRPDGIVVSQAETPFYEMERQRSLLQILGGSFRRVQIYNYVNMTYPGALWSFTFAFGSSSKIEPAADGTNSLARRRSAPLR